MGNDPPSYLSGELKKLEQSPANQPFDPILLWERKLSGRLCQRVDFEVFEESLADLVNRMFATMHGMGGQGIAAPQIGIFLQAAIVVINGNEFPIFNPSIVDSKGESMEWEGCLSLPGASGKLQASKNQVRISRSRWIKVCYQDMRGYPVEEEYEGWPARVFQHEIDHLSGVFIVDRVSQLFRDSCINKMRKYVRGVHRGRIDP